METLTTLTQSLQQQLTGKEPITREQIEAWRKQYPYFALPLLLYLREQGRRDAQAFATATAYVGDTELLLRLGGYDNDFSDLYPSQPTSQAENTDAAIDLFLQTYSKEGQTAGELPLSEDVVAEQPQIPLETIPAYDYMSTVEAMPDDAETAPMQGDDLLTRFIEADESGKQMFSRTERPLPTTPPPAQEELQEEENETLFTESLAKIYIRQRRYAKALEIIRRLNLNNPEKNIYFADQIRFLEKLINNIKN